MMPTDRELDAMMKGFLKRQGWCAELLEDSSHIKYIHLQHNDAWLFGMVVVDEAGYQVQFNIQEVDQDDEVILDYLTIVEDCETINQLRPILQKIVDDWRDVHKPIFNALLKLLKLREIAIGNPSPQIKNTAVKVCEELDKSKLGLEYFGHE